jgi:hypoxanthine phosphoribosyltransferase
MKQVHDKSFKLFITEKEIDSRIQELGKALTERYRDENPIFLVVLNGAFMFASDLMKTLDFDCEIHFIKLASYEGLSSTGNVKTVIGLNQNIEHRTIIIVEDIVDTGKTLYQLLPELDVLKPKSISICTLLQKPDALTVDLKVDFVGFEIPNKFVVGYGLDYDNLGRNFSAIYQLAI